MTLASTYTARNKVIRISHNPVFFLCWKHARMEISFKTAVHNFDAHLKSKTKKF